ncbi:MAG: ATP synthase subunit I [Bacillota bacterium]
MGLFAGEFERFTGKIIREAVWILVVLLAVLPWCPRNPLLGGFALGLAVSILNGFFLTLRMRKMLFLMPYGTDRAKIFVQVGMVSRWGLIFAVLYFAVKTGWFNLAAMLGGLLVVPIFSVCEAIRALIRGRVEVGA